jgi:DNA-binding phage protein
MTLPQKQHIEKVLTPEGLSKAIETVGMPMTTLAKESGVSRNSIYRYLDGTQQLVTSNLKALWDILLSCEK